MKTKSLLILAALISTSVFAGQLEIKEQPEIWKCSYTLDDNATGADVTGGLEAGYHSVYLETGHRNSVVIRNSASSLRSLSLKVTKEIVGGSPDDDGTPIANIQSFETKHNDRRDGKMFALASPSSSSLRFGDGKVFGTVSCEEPIATPFALVDGTGRIMSDEPYAGVDQDLYESMIAAPGGCIEGDLNAAIPLVQDFYVDPADGRSLAIQNFAVTADGNALQWTEVTQTCLKTVYNENERGGGNECVEFKEVSRRGVSLPGCK